jgi:FkbM family methyltransferase
MHYLKKIFSRIKILKYAKYINPAFSQEGEDIILRRFFEKNNIQKGFYIDIGCFHPIKYSNTFLLYKNGWEGINIDANPDAITLFNSYRPKDININTGISNSNETLTYYSFNLPALNTFSKSQVNLYLKNPTNVLLGEKKIKLNKLSDILENYLPNGQKITLLTVDVEGLDYEVLTSNDWTKYIPLVIVAENHTAELDNLINDKIYIFLTNKGYKLISKLDLSSIYVYKSFSNTHS